MKIAKSLAHRLLLPVLFSGLIAAALLVALNPGEPKFQGRDLSSWLWQYNINIIAGGDQDRIAMRDSAQLAIRSIGTNAIPELLKMLAKTDSKPKTELLLLLSKQRFIKLHWRSASSCNSEAAVGFQALGADAKEAVPW